MTLDAMKQSMAASQDKSMAQASGRLQDKVAIVTGSSSGLGRAIAIRYAQEGAKVVCSDLRPSARMDIAGEASVATHEVIAASGGDAVFIKCNVSSATEMEALVKEAALKYGRLDVMVNNAGIAPEASAETALPIHLCSEATWDLAMDVNAKSIFLGCRYAIIQMLSQLPHAPSGDRGWIINMSSIYGLVGSLTNPAYCASKGAVTNLTRQVALDYSKDRIHVNAICPGHVQTAIFQETTAVSKDEMLKMYPFKGPGLPEDIAKMAVVLASDDASWMTGALVSVDGGYVAR